jgi:hypothetical protein
MCRKAWGFESPLPHLALESDLLIPFHILTAFAVKVKLCGKMPMGMSYSKSLLLHQDEPAYGLLFRLIILAVPGILAASGIYLWSSGDSQGALALLFEAGFIGLIFWLVFPRRYLVYEDHLRIVLGGPFSMKIGFAGIKTIETTSRLSFNINFATRLAKSYVAIVRKKGLSIAITPRASDRFVEEANRALSNWTTRHKA